MAALELFDHFLRLFTSNLLAVLERDRETPGIVDGVCWQWAWPLGIACVGQRSLQLDCSSKFSSLPP